MNRRNFVVLGAAAAMFPTRLRADAELKSELLFDLIFERGPSSPIGAAGASHAVVAVAGGTFQGPRLKGTIVPPAGDWITGRSDGSGVVDIRMLLQTDDAQKISMTARGIFSARKDEPLYARILPMFETAAAKYAWLNDVVGVGVYRPMPGKIAYRVYQIL
jgi:hypothetical protein